MASAEIVFQAASLGATESAVPAIAEVGSNILKLAAAFDDTTQEYLNGSFKVPADIDTSGTVTFRVAGMPATHASANVEFDFDHDPVASGESFDAASPYTTEASGAKATQSSSPNGDIITWTETVANLGWAADDEVFFRISRDTGTNDTLVGDYYMFTFSVVVPLA